VFGTYRLCLAWCVVIEHLAGVSYVAHTGKFAVFGFYVLSGYLITRVLNDSYDFAFVPFWTNRFLRIYPQYLLLLPIGLALVLGTERAGEFLPPTWKASPQPSDWIAILTIFPMGFAPETWTFRPIPSIWSVGVELLNYAVLFAIVARRKQFAWIMLIAAAVYHVFSLWSGGDPWDRYSPFHAALLPFALGALIFFRTKAMTVRLSARGAALLCLPVLMNDVVAGYFEVGQPTHLFDVFSYLNLLFQGLAVAALSLAQKGPSQSFDRVFGDLSYPVFLCHWLVGYAIALAFFPGQWRGIPLMVVTLIVSTAVAYVMCRIHDAAIEPLRARVRASGASVKEPHRPEVLLGSWRPRLDSNQGPSA
jgi:peptidoglycan/LPS O-acetylase OafA/YrhL